MKSLGIAGIVLAIVGGSDPNQQTAQSSSMPVPSSITVYGGAGRVSGSLAIMNLPSASFMIDCGAYYPDGDGTVETKRGEASRQSASLPPGAETVTAVFLTHPHIDHIGRIPLLVDRGYKGPIYLREGSEPIAIAMLTGQVRYQSSTGRSWSWSRNSNANKRGKVPVITLHWVEDCEWFGRISRQNLETFKGTWDEADRELSRNGSTGSPCKTCAAIELQPVCRLLRPVREGKTIKIGGTRITPQSAGHVPGSVSYLFEVTEKNRTSRVVFSGDLGSGRSTTIGAAAPCPAADIVFCETTYACAPQPNSTFEDDMAAFRKAIADATGSGGIAWIPAFAFDRTQKVLIEISKAKRELAVSKDAKVYCPSPTARECTEAYEATPNRLHLPDALSKDLALLRPEGYQESLPPAVQKYLDEEKAKKLRIGGADGATGEDRQKAFEALRGNILVTTSGMVDEVFSRSLLEPLIASGNVTVFLVGYQDPGSPGGMLEAAEKEQRESIVVEGISLPLNAKVVKVSGFSAHARSGDIDQWLAGVGKNAKVILVHGGKTQLDERLKCLQSSGWECVSIAQANQPIPMFPSSTSGE